MTEQAPSDKDRNDREAGRQLAVVALFAGITLGGLVAWAFWGEPDFVRFAGWFGGLPLLVGVIAFVFPVHAIRLVMGRWAELFGDREPSSPLAKMQEGVPLDAVVAETVVTTKRGRARLGIAAMILGLSGCVLSGFAEAWGVLGPGSGMKVATSCFGLSVIGLIVWYRTL